MLYLAVLPLFHTLVSGSHVMTFALVHVTVTSIVGEHYHILPWCWVPVGVVVTFFGALVTTSATVGVLAGIDGSEIYEQNLEYTGICAQCTNVL